MTIDIYLINDIYIFNGFYYLISTYDLDGALYVNAGRFFAFFIGKEAMDKWTCVRISEFRKGFYAMPRSRGRTWGGLVCHD